MFDSATLKIGEETFTLRFPLKKMVQAEKMLGKPLQTVFVSTQSFSVKKGGKEEQVSFPTYELTDLITLFKVGISTEHPKVTEEKAEELLSEFLSSGKSLVVQTSILYTILGKALGFFRTGVDIQKRMDELINPLIKDENKN